MIGNIFIALAASAPVTFILSWLTSLFTAFMLMWLESTVNFWMYFGYWDNVAILTAAMTILSYPAVFSKLFGELED
jgi:hypothetical protein